MFTRQHILSEIVRTARDNGGRPLGVARFQAETGIKETDWLGKYWARWGDALTDAGLTRNTLQGAYQEGFLFTKLASLARKLGHFPARTEIQLETRSDRTFPHAKTFQRLGPKGELAAKLARFCETHDEYKDVRELCLPSIVASPPKDDSENREQLGYVYLLRSGRYYKVGHTNSVGRRERELVIQLPERANVVHAIKTDDPVGIESYWHCRFEARRKNGEWFELGAADLAAFKRRKFM